MRPGRAIVFRDPHGGEHVGIVAFPTASGANVTYPLSVERTMRERCSAPADAMRPATRAEIATAARLPPEVLAAYLAAEENP